MTTEDDDRFNAHDAAYRDACIGHALDALAYVYTRYPYQLIEEARASCSLDGDTFDLGPASVNGFPDDDGDTVHRGTE